MSLFLNKFITHLLLIFISILLILIKSQDLQNCQINPNCFQGCSDSTCVYDPSTNWFYNNSITDSTHYSGPYCCNGCNSGYFLWKDLITCSQLCSYVAGNRTYGNQLTRTCQFGCPYAYFGDNITTKCVNSCPNGSWASYDYNLCLSICPQQTPFHYTPNNTCILQCPQGNLTYINLNKTMCSPQCPDGLFVYLRQQTCVSQCPLFPNITYKNFITKTCENQCSTQLYYGDFQDQYICTSSCGIDNITKEQKYGQNSTSVCVLQCPQGSFAHDLVKICVKQCFQPYPVLNDIKNKCQAILQSNKNTLLIILISVILGFIVIISLVIFLYFYFKRKKNKEVKRKSVRIPYKYDFYKDISFSL